MIRKNRTIDFVIKTSFTENKNAIINLKNNIMKKLFFALLLAFGLNANAQTSKIDLERMFGPLINHDVPSETSAKSLGVTKDDILPIYIESQKGWCVIVGNQDGIVNFYTTQNLDIKGDYKKALTAVSAKNCNGRTDVNTLLCYVKDLKLSLSSLF